jgi:lactoylglutathione lyase
VIDMRYLHTMVRVRDLPAALRFFCDGLGLRELRRRDHEAGRFTLVFLGLDPATDSPQIELTHNWDQTEAYSVGRNFGHVAYEVDDIYAACQRLPPAEPWKSMGNTGEW